MIALNYLDNLQIRKDVEPLFVSAFPIDERPPADIYFESFKNHAKNTLYGFYKDGLFMGFASVVLYKDICYIFFLAIQDELRGQGYGSKILSMIKEMYQNDVILLCYEEVDKKYKDYENRRKRAGFYHKNGFIDNPLKTNEFGVIFQTAYYGNRPITFEEYQSIFRIGFGDWAVKYLKEVK